MATDDWKQLEWDEASAEENPEDIIAFQELNQAQVMELLNRNASEWRVRNQTRAQFSDVCYDNYFAPMVKKLFDQTQKTIKKKIGEYYLEFEELNPNYQDAKKFLDEDQISHFRDDVDAFMENTVLSEDDAAYYQSLILRKKISRLRAIETQIDIALDNLANGIIDASEDFFGNIFETSYYRSVYEIDRGLNGLVGESFATINEGQVKAALTQPWNDTTFPQDIWHNQEKLKKNLTKLITQATILGQNYLETAEQLHHAMGVSLKNCYTVVATESANIASIAQQECYEALGCEKYEIISVLDERTSQQCQTMDGTIFDMVDFAPGVTAPPFHDNCRTTTAPYYDFGDLEDLVAHKRASRIGGKTTWVEDMKYPEWAKKNNIEPIYGLAKPGSIGVIYDRETDQLLDVGLGENAPPDLKLTKTDYFSVTRQIARTGFDMGDTLDYFPTSPDAFDYDFATDAVDEVLGVLGAPLIKVQKYGGNLVEYLSDMGQVSINSQTRTIEDFKDILDLPGEYWDVLNILQEAGIEY